MTKREAEIVTVHEDGYRNETRRFFWTSVFAFSFSISLWAFLVGVGAYQILSDLFQAYDASANDGLVGLGLVTYSIIAGFVGAAFGIFPALLFIRWLNKKWGKDLEFGRHPVLKLAVFAFITAVALLLTLLIVAALVFGESYGA